MSRLDGGPEADAIPTAGPVGWQPIATAPRGECVLYFPAQEGRNAMCAMTRVDHYPVPYPRKPTHWMPLPAPPAGPEEGR